MNTTTATTPAATVPCRWCSGGYVKSGGIVGMMQQCGCCNAAQPAGRLGLHIDGDPQAACLHDNDPEVVAAREAKQAAARAAFQEQQRIARERDL